MIARAVFEALVPLMVVFVGVCAIVAVARIGGFAYRTKLKQIPDIAPLFSVAGACFMLWIASSYLAALDYGSAVFVAFAAGFPALGGVVFSYGGRDTAKPKGKLVRKVNSTRISQ